MKPKTLLFYDLEVSRAIAEGYGSKWEFKVVKFIRPQLLMCYAYKWLGDKKPTFVSMHDFKTYKQFVQSLSDLLSSAPIAVAHNAVRFDNKMSNTFFITEDITPPSPFKTIDTLQVARSAFKFPSNSLNDLADYLGLGKKEQVTYAELEDDFMTKRPSGRVLRLMKRYNNKDVELLEKVYLKIRPYIKNHPNMAVYTGDAFACPGCGTADKLQRRGTRTNGLGTYQEWYCKHCDKYPSQRISDKTAIKPELVNRG